MDTEEPLLWGTSIQKDTSIPGTTNLLKHFRTIFVFVTSIEGTPLFGVLPLLVPRSERVGTSTEGPW